MEEVASVALQVLGVPFFFGECCDDDRDRDLARDARGEEEVELLELLCCRLQVDDDDDTVSLGLNHDSNRENRDGLCDAL